MKKEEIEKVGRKWVVKGKGNGWIFNKIFPTKWKAEVALEVFKEGGRVSDYWKKQREVGLSHPMRIPRKVLQKVGAALDEIEKLQPTCEEIEEYGESANYGEVTITENERYFPPRLHDTWGIKQGGRVHIDMGCKGVHLMLDQYNAIEFINFIKRKRGINKEE